MHHQTPRTSRLLVAVSLALTFAASALAQSTGTITGHVFNAVNKEFVRDAEIHVEGTNITVPSETSGAFTLARVPAGEVTVTVNYTRLPPTSAKIVVSAGATVAHEFEIGGRPPSAGRGPLGTTHGTPPGSGPPTRLQRPRNTL